MVDQPFGTALFVNLPKGELSNQFEEIFVIMKSKIFNIRRVFLIVAALFAMAAASLFSQI